MGLIYSTEFKKNTDTNLPFTLNHPATPSINVVKSH